MTVLLKGTNDMITRFQEIPECVHYKNINIKNKYPRDMPGDIIYYANLDTSFFWLLF